MVCTTHVFVVVFLLLTLCPHFPQEQTEEAGARRIPSTIFWYTIPMDEMAAHALPTGSYTSVGVDMRLLRFQ